MIARFLACCALLFPFAASAQTVAPVKKPVLLVLTNHSELGKTEKKTGFFLSEAAHPWEVFKAAGREVVLASPKGGFSPLDPKSFDLKDQANDQFWGKYGSGDMVKGDLGVKETLSLPEVNPADYAGVFFAGGHGAMWDFRGNPEIQRVAGAIYQHGGVVGAVCHGPAALVDVKLPDGAPLVKGKKVAVFTNSEEEAVKLTEVVPFALETEMEKAGAKPVPGKNFEENAVLDGRLATGQNPASAKKAAELFVQALSKE